MSWEPLLPMGFSPCGTAFGVLEGPAYSASCRFFADGGFPNRIFWYRVPDDRPFYEGMHTFLPRRDDQYNPSGQEMEVVKHRPNPRAYYSGRDQWFLDGTHVHGDPEDFLGLSSFTKYSPEGRLSNGPCGEPSHFFECLALKDFVSKEPLEAFKERLGLLCVGIDVGADIEVRVDALALGDFLLDRPIETMANGLRLMGVATDEVFPTEEFFAGLALGDLLIQGAIETRVNGLQLGDVLLSVPPGPEVLAAGLALGVHQVDLVGGPETLGEGLTLGDIEVDVVAPTQTIAQGLKLGVIQLNHKFPPHDSETEEFYNGLQQGTILDNEATTETKVNGLDLGDIVVDVTPGVTPGSTCATALVVVMGTTYTVSMPASGTHWFVFYDPFTSPWHVKLTTTSGPSLTADVRLGTDCASSFSAGGLDSITTCYYVPTFFAYHWYVNVVGSLGGASTYTLEFALGACP